MWRSRSGRFSRGIVFFFARPQLVRALLSDRLVRQQQKSQTVPAWQRGLAASAICRSHLRSEVHRLRAAMERRSATQVTARDTGLYETLLRRQRLSASRGSVPGRTAVSRDSSHLFAFPIEGASC